MPLSQTTADQLSTALTRCVRAIVRNKANTPHIHPRVDNSSIRTLFALTDEGGARISSLADSCHYDVSTMSRQISALEESGLVRRIPDPKDRRASVVELTDAGQEAVEEIRATRARWVSELLVGWDDQEAAAFVAHLERFASAVDVKAHSQNHSPRGEGERSE